MRVAEQLYPEKQMRARLHTQVIAIILSIVCLVVPLWPVQVSEAPAAMPAVPGRHRPPAPRSAPPDPERLTARLLELINQARWENGHIPPLKANPALNRSAQSHSQSMAENDFFGHKGADNSSPWDRIEAVEYGNWYMLAENIAAGYTTPEEVIQAWMDSPRHLENLMNPDLNEIGLGYAFQAEDTYPGTTWGYEHYWTSDMGTRWDAYPVVIAGEAYSTTTSLVSLYVYGEGWAQDMRLSNDGTTWSEWRPYQTMLTWELPPGRGVRQVYVQLRDAQGNTMQSDDEILLEEPPAPPGQGGSTPIVSLPRAVFVMQEKQVIGQPRWHYFWISDSADEGRTCRAYFLSPGTYTATLTIQGEEGEASALVHLYVFPQVYTLYLPILAGPSSP